MKRIAIQFSGLFRGLRFKENRDLQYERTVKSFEDQGFEVDTFWFLYDKELPLDPEIIPNLSTTFNAKDVTIYKDDEIQRLLEKEKILDFYSFPPQYYSTSIDNAILLNFFGEKTKINDTRVPYGWFKYLYSLQKNNELRKAYQEKYNINYELILFVEPPAIPQKPFKAIKNKNVLHISPIIGNDGSFFMGDEKHIDIVSNMYSFMIKNKKIKTDLNSTQKGVDHLYPAYFKEHCKIKETLPNIERKTRWFHPLLHAHSTDDQYEKILNELDSSLEQIKLDFLP